MTRHYVTLHLPLQNAKRFKLNIPFQFHAIRAQIKALDSSFWHPDQKLWSLLNTEENIVSIKSICGKHLKTTASKALKPLPKISLSQALSLIHI